MNFEIPLSAGHFAIVDGEDLNDLMLFKWYATNPHRNGRFIYAQRTTSGRERTLGAGQSVKMHRYILDAPDGMCVDHINGNGLDNRRSNLRVCTPQQNLSGRRKHHRGSSMYRGVSANRQSGFSARISINGEGRYIGNFPTEESAARAWDAAARHHYGRFATLNFPRDGETPAVVSA